jgi:hypothetical protein
VKLGYNAKAEKRLAGLVYNFLPPFRACFDWIVEVTEYLAGGFYRFYLNRAHVGNSIPRMVRGLVPVTGHKKAFRHISPAFPVPWQHVLRVRITGCLRETAHIWE